MGIRIGAPKPSIVGTAKPNSCRGCVLYETGTGFVPGTFKQQPLIIIENGIAGKNVLANVGEATLGFCGEAPAHDELVMGQPFAGKAGSLLKSWVFQNAGVDFEEAVVDNVIRCVQPGNKLPNVEVLRQARDYCKQYDRWDEFNPSRDVLTLHPASLLRDVVPLPLVVHDVGKARELSETGVKVRVLLGKTAVQKFYPFITNITRWRGNVEEVEK